MKPQLRALLTISALLAGGCGSAQERAYENAARMEQQLSADRLGAAVAEYQRVIRIEPGTPWAKKAQERIDAVQARIQKADELHKSVFHENGID
ncbi:MAG TPA: hypothetical protein VKG78_04215 [Opitutaceae bacterium]|nr:hypothetical protein [Opitutaceae bacterium]